MNWDEYFFNIADAVAKKSPCLSKQKGAILVKGKHAVAMGYNGPPSKHPHCSNKLYREEIFSKMITDGILLPRLTFLDNNELVGDNINICPRKIANFESGEGLEYCPAAHAERNALIEAARIGVSTNECILYTTRPYPCRECAKEIVNAGIKEVVITNGNQYPEKGLTGRKILEDCDVKVRIGRY